MHNHKNAQRNTKNAERNAEQKSLRNSIKFTHLSIQHLKTSKKREIFWCIGMTGFGIEVSKKGSKSWIFQYRINGKGKRMKLGNYPKIPLAEATKLYSDANNKVNMGVDPLEERQNKKKKKDEEPTVAELIEIFAEHSKGSGKKTYRAEQRLLERCLPDYIKNKKASEVTPKEIAQIVNKLIAKGTVVTAQHLFKRIKRMYNFAAEIYLLKKRDNPCLDVKIKFPKNKRQRHLTPKEIHLFWNNLENVPMSEIMRLAIRFLLLTVARPIEVREMKWSHVDFDRKIWTLPTTKNGRLHRVYLGELAIKVLEKAKEFTGDKELVFGSTRHFRRSSSDLKSDQKLEVMKPWSLSQPFRRHFAKLEIEEKFYPYDLRRTGATIIAGLYGRRDLAVLALNHTTTDVTDIYDQYSYDREKMMSLNALNKAIEIIVNSPTIESVPSFEELRQRVTQPVHRVNLQQEGTINSQKDFQASFSNPVSYTLSYGHDESRRPI